MAEWSNAAVLKTVVPRGTGGSNPSLSAEKNSNFKQIPVGKYLRGFFVSKSVYKKAEKKHVRRWILGGLKIHNFSPPEEVQECFQVPPKSLAQLGGY